MNYHWLINNSSFFLCFGLSLLLGIIVFFLFDIFFFVFASLFPWFLLYTFHSPYYIYLYLSSVLVFCFCSHNIICFFFAFFNIFYLNIWCPFVSLR